MLLDRIVISSGHFYLVIDVDLMFSIMFSSFEKTRSKSESLWFSLILVASLTR